MLIYVNVNGIGFALSFFNVESLCQGGIEKPIATFTITLPLTVVRIFVSTGMRWRVLPVVEPCIMELASETVGHHLS